MSTTRVSRRTRLPAAQRRAQILDVATGLIADTGFWGLSLLDVADRCGITVQGLLHHFGSKEQLLVEVLAHRDVLDGAILARELGMSTEQMILAMEAGDISIPGLCEASIRHNAQQPEIIRLYVVLQAESLSPEHPAHEYFANRHRSALAFLAAAAEGHSRDPAGLARQVLAAMDGLQLQWLRAPESIDLVAEWQSMSRVLFRDLTDDPSSSRPRSRGRSESA